MDTYYCQNLLDFTFEKHKYFPSLQRLLNNNWTVKYSLEYLIYDMQTYITINLPYHSVFATGALKDAIIR